MTGALTRRLIVNSVAALFVGVGLTIALAVYGTTLGAAAFVSGWLLLGAMALLVLYNIRRRLPFLTIGDSSSWLQLHVFTGLVAVLLFGLHIDWSLPNGSLEALLTLGFVLVTGSGLIGLAIARNVPHRMATRGNEVIFERIPVLRRELKERAEALVLTSVEETRSTTIADYYADRLAGFFAKPRNFWYHARQSTLPWHRLLAEMDSLDRYLDNREREMLSEIKELARAKDNLDYHYTMQALMRRWQFVHVPVTYALLVLIALHVIVAYAFA